MQTPRTSSKVVLVKQALAAAESRRTAVPIRRFRIARMPLVGGSVSAVRLEAAHTA